MPTRKSNRLLSSDLAIPPGEFLAEEMAARAITIPELALLTRWAGKTIRAIIRGQIVLTREMATELENALGIPEHIWLSLEAQHRATKTRSGHRCPPEQA